MTECCPSSDAIACEVEIDKMAMDFVENAYIECEGPSNIEPYVGMEFESEETAKIFYNTYARSVGFSIRLSVNRRSKRDGRIIGRHFVCSKEGFREKKYSSGQRSRPITREGCKAMIKVKMVDSGKWVITKFIKEHNHALVTSREVSLLRSHRRMRNFANASSDARTNPSCVMPLSRPQIGQSSNIDFTLQGCIDDIQSIRRRIFGEDTQHIDYILDYFARMQVRDPSFFYAIQPDEEGCVTNLFWADGRSRMDFQYFSDVVTFETTYKRNHNGFPLVSFVGVNHHRQPVLFGCALLLDDSKSSFLWLFNTWFEAMFRRYPVSLLTDQNATIEAAIAMIFPKTNHRFCKRHILNQLSEKLGHVELKNHNFREDFCKCISLTEMNDEFESCWWSFIDKYELRDNEWLQSLYKCREQWVQVYLHDIFSSNMGSAQRCESMTSFLEEYVDVPANLQVLINQYERAQDSWHKMEVEEDLKTTSYTKPGVKMGLPLENQAMGNYTRTMFMKFHEEFLSSHRFMSEKTKEEGSTSMFRVVEFGSDKRARTVKFNASNVTVICSCQMFEFSGILCRHALRVLSIKNVMLLPAHYILKRWTRNARSGIAFDEQGIEMYGDAKGSRAWRYIYLCQLANKIARESAKTVETYNLAMCVLQKAFEELHVARKNVQTIAVVGSSTSNSVQGDNICKDSSKVPNG
ncbi:hypothetical protein AMTRI_Chr11g158670 [Amborella trichopoda]|uniref:protein FAR1-RELATED SEQUENCE 5-like isoform X2 n=1 Tax=Amborella trichopoda TaxID=13333 RepID=UPI0005D4398C|nr:protein FAR1-RELATED SEQUENCE 5-like isoform X2 [Amborella trichopoda]|eukprot:XP_011621044.1 protein FAR1-RELATED SEQUENCE 5-like isoform X2 [Amborella trichopoda]